MRETKFINPSVTELGEKFTQLEPDSITVEEGELIYAIVRMRKPGLAIETGTGHGQATRKIVEAMQVNGCGRLISCDTDEEYVIDAQLELPSIFVKVVKSTGLHVLSGLSEKPEFILVDAGNLDNRLAELKLIIENGLLAPKGTLVIHDAANKDYKRLVQYVQSYSWPGMVFDSLAGIAVFQRL
jgi:predicted O-methyltransferase YrrM